jgi:hypothetical protein
LGGSIDDYKLNDDINRLIIESFSFVSNKHCDVIGGRIYITHCCFIMIQKILLENKRQMPIYFGFPKRENNINIELLQDIK